MNSKLKRTIIYHRYATAKSCFDGRGYTDIDVHGYLVKYEWFGMTWYRIKIYKPHISGCMDGCYSSRAKLRSYASAIRQELKRLLFKYKHGNTEQRGS